MNKLLKQTLVCAGTLLLSMQVVAKPYNHPDSLTLENQEKISQALDILGYKKNKLAKVLANGKSEFIGIIVPNPVSYTHLDVYKRQGSCGLSQAAFPDADCAVQARLPAAPSSSRHCCRP